MAKDIFEGMAFALPEKGKLQAAQLGVGVSTLYRHLPGGRSAALSR